jgi:hypothetical protein
VSHLIPVTNQATQHRAPAGFFTGCHYASLRTQAVSQSVETEAIDLFLVPLETTPGRTQPLSSLATSPRGGQDCQRSKTTKNDRILSNFTKNRRPSSPEGTAENQTCPN